MLLPGRQRKNFQSDNVGTEEAEGHESFSRIAGENVKAVKLFSREYGDMP